MRRVISFIGVILLSLTLSGVSSVLAAAFCPHATGNAQALSEDTAVFESRRMRYRTGKPH